MLCSVQVTVTGEEAETFLVPGVGVTLTESECSGSGESVPECLVESVDCGTAPVRLSLPVLESIANYQL